MKKYSKYNAFYNIRLVCKTSFYPSAAFLIILMLNVILHQKIGNPVITLDITDKVFFFHRLNVISFVKFLRFLRSATDKVVNFEENKAGKN